MEVCVAQSSGTQAWGKKMFRLNAKRKLLAIVGFTFVLCLPRISLAHTETRGELEVIHDALDRIEIELLENQTKLEITVKELSQIPSTNPNEILAIIGIIGAIREMVVMVHYESFLTGTTLSIRERPWPAAIDAGGKSGRGTKMGRPAPTASRPGLRWDCFGPLTGRGSGLPPERRLVRHRCSARSSRSMER